MGWNQTITLGDAVLLFVALALALTFLVALVKWRRRSHAHSASDTHSHTPAAPVIAKVEAIPSLNVEGSYRAIRIVLRNRGETRTTIEEIILCRRPGWFEFGILGPLVRFSGLTPWRFNVGFASRKTVPLPVTLDVNGLWESHIPLEPEDPNNKEELRQFERLKFNEALKVLRSGAMRYSIQLSCRAVAPSEGGSCRAVAPGEGGSCRADSLAAPNRSDRGPRRNQVKPVAPSDAEFGPTRFLAGAVSPSAC